MAEVLPLMLGVATGLVLGLTGAGGSVLAVPLLMFGLGWTLTQAAPVSLLAVSAAALFGTVVAWDVTYVRYRAALLMGAASLLTAPVGLWAARQISGVALSGAFAAVMIGVALRLWRQARRHPEETRIVRASVAGDGGAVRGHLCRLNARGRIIWTPASVAVVASIGALTGLVSGLFGVGGGFIIVPALLAFSELSVHSAIATSLMSIALISGSTFALASLSGGITDWISTLPFALGALAGMLAGRKLSSRIAGPRLQQGFAVLTLLTALGLLFTAFHRN